MNNTKQLEQYESPWTVESLDQCTFYHTMDVPGFGVQHGMWDLRDTVGSYLSNYDFNGKRVLDIGSASGMLTFYMEDHGAEVVSYDAARWDCLPPNPDTASALIKVKNSYWISHRLRGSKAKVFYGDVYALPEWLGKFDITIFGSILLHLKHPFLALESASKLSNSMMVIDAIRPELSDELVFRPGFPKEQDMSYWWYVSKVAASKMLHTLGFPNQSSKIVSAYGITNRMDLYSIVASRLL